MISSEIGNDSRDFARCLGGGRLLGDKLLRITYLDEAGKSKKQEEPYLVVAGIILNADEHWKALEDRMRAIGRRYLPNVLKPIFHAKDIFHGTGLYDRRLPEWSRERRGHLLSELCEIPRDFKFPVVLGFTERARHEGAVLKLLPKATKEQLLTICHADAFLKAALGVEAWMMRAAPKESAMIIAEDAPKVKKMIKAVHAGYVDRFSALGENYKTFHANHIVETVHFAEKAESMPLQVADACAFVMKRHAMDKDDVDTFYNVLRKEIVWYNDDADGLMHIEAA